MSDYGGKRVKLLQMRLRRSHLRLRRRIRGTAKRPRLAVTKSLQFIYAQVIDDDRGHTLAQASSRELDILSTLKKSPSSKEAARLVGELIAKRAKDQDIVSVVFDRGGFVYHGKIREVAEGARSLGLKF